MTNTGIEKIKENAIVTPSWSTLTMTSLKATTRVLTLSDLRYRLGVR